MCTHHVLEDRRKEQQAPGRPVDAAGLQQGLGTDCERHVVENAAQSGEACRTAAGSHHENPHNILLYRK